MDICNVIMQKLVFTMNGREITFILILSFVLKWGNHFCCCIFPQQKLDRVSWKNAHTGELVLRQARTEPQGRHREADADISSKRNLLWLLRDHLSSSSTVFPQDLYP